jgi:hypothetical protein
MIHTAGATRRISQRPFATEAFQHGKTNSNPLTRARAKSFLMTPGPCLEDDQRSPGYDIMQLGNP